MGQICNYYADTQIGFTWREISTGSIKWSSLVTVRREITIANGSAVTASLNANSYVNVPNGFSWYGARPSLARIQVQGTNGDITLFDGGFPTGANGEDQFIIQLINTSGSLNNAQGFALESITTSVSLIGISLIPQTCRCTPDSCRVNCASAPDGFCCIDNSFTDRLLQIIKN